MNHQDLISWLKLCNVNGVGPKKIMRLLTIFKDIPTIVDASVSDFLRSGVFNEEMVEDWIKLKSASSQKFEEKLLECEENNIEIITLASKEYPQRLKLISNPPLNLFIRGDKKLLYSKKIAIVGSRGSDNDAKEWALQKAYELAKRNVTIISGGAQGIDYAAHRGALDASGNTICVFGTGLLSPYPKEHKPLFKEIISNGGLLISENLPTFSGSRIALLQRNRITSGLSDALIAVTASLKGGSMTQLMHAHNQRIPLFCPSFGLGFSPSEGLKEVKKKYNIWEISEIEQVLDFIDNQNKSSVLPQQRTLF
ncbi:MAG: hypothetical protein CVT48_01925 [Thermoplasmata archaeon HGW-Thermoplasmata-1]|nr:MAG: hypothetical protein CVT48_01925 [Thermoplasmata archaeon HGW-Thermoplasmata-1]